MGRFRSSRRRAASKAAGAAAVAIVVAVAALGYAVYAGPTTSGKVSLMSSTISSQSGQIGSLEATVGTLHSNVTSLQGELAGADGQLASLQGKLAAVSLELNTTESTDSATIQRLSAEVQSLNATIQALEAQFVTHTGPALFQEEGSTCSSTCDSGSANVTLPSEARQGDMLVITIVSDDLTNLVVRDSLGTMLSLAVSSTTSPDCTTNSGSCQADIYWGSFPSQAPTRSR